MEIITRRGKSYSVQRNEKGHFIKGSWKIYRIEVPPPPPPPKDDKYKYGIIIRVAYKGRLGHSRRGEIYGEIISRERLTDREIIEKSIDRLKGLDYWLDYVDPNEKMIIHIDRSTTYKYEKIDIKFRDLG